MIGRKRSSKERKGVRNAKYNVYSAITERNLAPPHLWKQIISRIPVIFRRSIFYSIFPSVTASIYLHMIYPFGWLQTFQFYFQKQRKIFLSL